MLACGMIAARFAFAAGLLLGRIRRRRPGEARAPPRRRARRTTARISTPTAIRPSSIERGRHRRLVHLSPATAAIMPNAMSATAPTAKGRAMPRRSSIRSSASTYAEFLEVVTNGRQNVGQGQAERHARLRHQPERDVLHRRSLHLSARARAGRSAARPAGQARRQAARRRRGGEGVLRQLTRRARRAHRGAVRRCRRARARAGRRSCRSVPGSAPRSSWSTRRSCASAPTPNNMPFSNEKRGGLRADSSPSCSPKSSARPSPTPIFRRSPASCA